MKKARYAHYLIRRCYDDSWEWVLMQSVRVLAQSATRFATRRKAVAAAKLAQKYAKVAEITQEEK